MDGPTVALAHAPEGAGNATRMLAVAAELDRRGVDVAVGGGGPGTRFFELNGFETVAPTPVEFVGRGSFARALANATRCGARRLREFGRWLDGVEPAAVLTDDPFAAAAATLRNVPFFRLDHSRATDFSAVPERVAFSLFNGYCVRTAEAFFYTSLWPDRAPPEVVPVGPLAYEPADPESVEPFDVLVVPGTHSTGFDRLASDLREAGHSVRLVGGPDWEPVPAMLPYADAADVVVCTGFSSIAEAAVAGTPCVVYPFIGCQRGIAQRIEAYGVEGVSVVRSVEAAREAVLSPPPAPAVENGTGAVADHLVEFAGAP